MAHANGQPPAQEARVADLHQTQNETDWRALPDGVECDWRSGAAAAIVVPAVILLEFLAMDALIIIGLAKGGRRVVPLFPLVSTAGACAMFTLLFGYLVFRNVRGRGLPSRLR